MLIGLTEYYLKSKHNVSVDYVLTRLSLKLTSSGTQDMRTYIGKS